MKEADRRYIEGVPGREKIRGLLAGKGMTQVDWAKKANLSDSEVSMVLRGHRRGEAVRDALAAELDLPRSEIDRLIDEQREEENDGTH